MSTFHFLADIENRHFNGYGTQQTSRLSFYNFELPPYNSVLLASTSFILSSTGEYIFWKHDF